MILCLFLYSDTSEKLLILRIGANEDIHYDSGVLMGSVALGKG